MSYYKRFGIILSNPLFQTYIRWAYQKGISDLTKLQFTPPFAKKEFTCLLCGVGNEKTAAEFIKFVIQKNKYAKIFIIDIGQEQIEAVKKLIHDKYSNLNIKVIKTDALELEKFIKKESIDWIETDFIFSFFGKKSLGQLFHIWRNLLSLQGFITTREIVVIGPVSNIIDKLKIFIGKIWLGVNLYSHSKQEIEDQFSSTGFKIKENTLFLPFLKSWTLIKRK